MKRCDEAFERTAPGLRPPASVDSAGLREAMAAVRRAWHEGGKGPVFARLSADPELANAAANDDIAAVLADGALTPDQIVYTGARSVRAEPVALVFHGLIHDE